MSDHGVSANLPATASPARTIIPRASNWELRDDRRLLEGPRSRLDEFLRVCRICFEFIQGFRALHWLGPCVTVFGSARFPETHPYYRQAQQLGNRLATLGFTVMTGGGPGIMEAANRGAHEVGGRSVGCNILLPHEQQANPYVDKVVTFRYFFVRKVMLVKYSQAFVIFPGGFGTLDEAFEAATLIQTGKIKNFPLIFVGREYWRPLFQFLEQRLLAEGAILASDLDRLVLTDNLDEVVAELATCPSTPHPPRPGEARTRSWDLSDAQ